MAASFELRNVELIKVMSQLLCSGDICWSNCGNAAKNKNLMNPEFFCSDVTGATFKSIMTFVLFFFLFFFSYYCKRKRAKIRGATEEYIDIILIHLKKLNSHPDSHLKTPQARLGTFWVYYFSLCDQSVCRFTSLCHHIVSLLPFCALCGHFVSLVDSLWLFFVSF